MGAIKTGVCGASSPNDCHDPMFTGGAYQTQNVTVRYNTFRIGMGISIGSESRGGIMENIMFRNNTVYNNSGFIDMETNYQSGDVGPEGYPATVVRNISFVGNRALGGATGVTFKCSVKDVCEEISVINNTVLNSDRPWHCNFVHSYNVAGNSPSGMEECMRDSMNRTAYV